MGKRREAKKIGGSTFNLYKAYSHLFVFVRNNDGWEITSIRTLGEVNVYPWKLINARCTQVFRAEDFN